MDLELYIKLNGIGSAPKGTRERLEPYLREIAEREVKRGLLANIPHDSVSVGVQVKASDYTRMRGTRRVSSED